MKTHLIASFAALGLLAAPVYAATPAKAPVAKAKVVKVSKHAKKKPAADATTKTN
ncbi:hypothetical protein [Sphingomonas sp.]|uniref:hypothetical protein n=1 Tax=Sphingomonas sp. TaxID=28214 RepID=UPI00286D1CB7|nr:hypothetical protein [Sphingomonas sp.]